MKLNAQIKTEVGKGVNRKLRANGEVPAILYGPQQDPVPLILQQNEVGKLLKAGGKRRINELVINGVTGGDKSTLVMIRDIQRNALSGELIHIDFYSIRKGHKLSLTVPVVLRGQAVGVTDGGGALQFLTREMVIECLPKDLPEYIEVDVTELEVGNSIALADLTLPEGVTLADEPAKVVASVIIITASVEDEEEEEGEEVEGEADGETEAAEAE